MLIESYETLYPYVLQADYKFHQECSTTLASPDNRAAGLLALRTVAEAYGGLGAVAAEAGISRESLYRTLSANGNPTLKTLLAVLKAVGMKLSVEPDRQAA